MGLDTAPLVTLPGIDPTTPRTTKDIYVRAIIHREFKVLSIHPDTFEEAVDWMKETELTKYLSPKETRTIANGSFSAQEEVDYSWYSESLYIFLRVLGIVTKELGPAEEADMAPHVGILPPSASVKKLEAAIKRISDEQLFVLRDTYYLLHWLSRRGHASIHPSIVIERRKALEWIADDQLAWDEITLDT